MDMLGSTTKEQPIAASLQVQIHMVQSNTKTALHFTRVGLGVGGGMQRVGAEKTRSDGMQW